MVNVDRGVLMVRWNTKRCTRLTTTDSALGVIICHLLLSPIRKAVLLAVHRPTFSSTTTLDQMVTATT